MIKNELSTIKLPRVQIFIQIRLSWNLTPYINGRGQVHPNGVTRKSLGQNNNWNEISIIIKTLETGYGGYEGVLPLFSVQNVVVFIGDRGSRAQKSWIHMISFK